MKKLATALLVTSLSAPAAFADDTRWPQHIGVGGGALLGALAGGPVGLAIGATFGNFIGVDKIKTFELNQAEDQLAAVNRSIDLKQTQLTQLEQQLADREIELAQRDSQLVAMQGLVQAVPMALFFESKSAQLADRYVPTLKALADASRSLPDMKVELVGHADQRGDAVENQA